ncbi:hypothetical protein Fot_33624 [Forsythia ovata]|uniref:Uncharacterized protein n=1 Tax=Forsythia ovata TaxID=205694 RepID=A0ABD1TB87_9LAMI
MQPNKISTYRFHDSSYMECYQKKSFEQQPSAPIRHPNLPLISPPIPFKNRISRRSNTRDFEWNQTTIRKTAIEKGQRATAEKKGQRAAGDRNRASRATGDKDRVSERAADDKDRVSERAERPDKNGELASQQTAAAGLLFCEGQWLEAIDIW